MSLLTIYKKYKMMILYLLFGGITTFINIATFQACRNLFNISTFNSNIIAWIVAVLFAFVTNKLYVFDSKSTKPDVLIKELVSFTAFRIASGVVDQAIVVIGIDYLGYYDLYVKIFSNVIVVIINYIASKLFVFRKKK